MNPLLALLFLLWSGFALADPASLPDELAEEAGMLGSILSDGRAVFYPESASYLSLSSLNGPGYSNGVAVLMTLGGLGRRSNQQSVPCLVRHQRQHCWRVAGQDLSLTLCSSRWGQG